MRSKGWEAPMRFAIMNLMGVSAATAVRRLSLAGLVSCLLFFTIGTAPAQAYGDGTAALCRVTESRATVTTVNATARVESLVCFYEIQYRAVIMYPIIEVQSRIVGDGPLLTNCTIGYEGLNSAGQVILSDTFMAYGPIFPGYNYYAQRPIYKSNNLTQFRVRSISCSETQRPQGLFAGFGVRVGTPVQGQYQKTVPVTFTNTSKEEYVITGEMTYRSPSFDVVGIVDIFGDGCSPRDMALKPGETKTCYFLQPDYTTNPNFPYTISDYYYQSTYQILAPKFITYPTVTGRPAVNSQVTATPAVITGAYSTSIYWWACTSPVRTAGIGKPPSQCTAIPKTSGRTTYRITSANVGKHLLVESFGRSLGGDVFAYSKSIGPVRR